MTTISLLLTEWENRLKQRVGNNFSPAIYPKSSMADKSRRCWSKSRNNFGLIRFALCVCAWVDEWVKEKKAFRMRVQFKSIKELNENQSDRWLIESAFRLIGQLSTALPFSPFVVALLLPFLVLFFVYERRFISSPVFHLLIEKTFIRLFSPFFPRANKQWPSCPPQSGL